MLSSASPELRRLAQTYIWWKSPDEALSAPERVAAQVMDIGDFDDVCTLTRLIGDDGLRVVIGKAEAGQFSARSWHYWHYRLGLARTVADIPPLPLRKVA